MDVWVVQAPQQGGTLQEPADLVSVTILLLKTYKLGDCEFHFPKIMGVALVKNLWWPILGFKSQKRTCWMLYWSRKKKIGHFFDISY